MLRHFFKKKIRFGLLSMVLLLSACEEEYVCPIPGIDRFELQPHVIIRADDVLNAQTRNHVGYKGHGVIIYHYYDDEVHAFDATCANSAECVESGVVAFDGVGKLTATCKRCGSQYYLRDGKHLNKKVMLRPYNVQKFSTDYYRVSNY